MSVTRPRLADPLEQILVSGSDTRSEIDAQTGLNSFGCAPVPRPDALSFGSATASSISPGAFRYVEEERGRLLERPAALRLLDEPMEQLRSEMKALLGLGQSEAEVIFSSSGTDSTLHALFLAHALRAAAPLDSIVAASDETGSGVPQALSGRHFNTITAEGISVTRGGPIAGLFEDVTLAALPRRHSGGTLRSAAEMDQEVLEAVSRSVAAGRRVLLQAVDSSKLGVRCPSPACLRSIQSRFAASVHIVIDACQMRISRPRLQWHLAQGHMVLVSGSKFFTGPPFSGALLVPACLSRSLEAVHHVPLGLQDYTNRSAWPTAWRSIRDSLPDRINLGQYFRWTAALEEMRAYFSIPPEFRRLALHQFAEMATDLIHGRSPEICLLEGWRPSGGEADEAEMGARTIFPILLRQGNGWMSFAEATALYAALNRDLTACLPDSLSPQEKALAAQLCHVGQPVRVAMGPQEQAGALRICASARTVSQVWSRHREDPAALRLAQERREVSTILEKTALVARHFASLPLA